MTMKKQAQTRIIFDRRNTATKTRKASVVIEVLYSRQRKYYPTGVRLTLDQWDVKRMMVKNCADAASLRVRLKVAKQKIDEYICSCDEQDIEFSFSSLDAHLNRKHNEQKSFIDFCIDYMKTRRDIRETTRRAHGKLVTSLMAFGKIVKFADLTKANIIEYDDYISNIPNARGEYIQTSSKNNYHKLMKSYINEAIRRDYITTNPYTSLKFAKAEEEMHGYLTIEELEKFEQAEFSANYLDRARDVFLFQCYTGLAYADVATFGRDKAEMHNGRYVVSAQRFKTNKYYYFVLIDKAVALLDKYDWQLPVISNQKYNTYLKQIARLLHIDKQITSHYARRTAGMVYLNSGMPIEIVAKILGHANIKTTQKAYAHILDKTVEDAFDKLLNKNK